MLKPNELRIGNILVDNFTGDYLKVDEIRTDGFTVDTIIEPGNNPLPNGWQARGVPLTWDIIKRCGFVSQDDDFVVWTIKSPRGNGLAIIIYNNGDHWALNEPGSKQFTQLHEVQNLYFALTGEELQIKIK